MDRRLLLLTGLLRGTLSPDEVAGAIGSSDEADALLEGLEPSEREALETDLATRGDSPASQARGLLEALRQEDLADESLLALLPADWLPVAADVTIDRTPSDPDMTIDRETADPDMTIEPGEHRRVLLEPASERQQDPHSITRFLAEGGLGQVFVAQDTRLGREVVLKQLQPEQADNDESMGRFMREAQVTGQLEHPNIVPIYGLGWDKHDAPYYTMKYVRGRTFGDLIDDYHQQKQAGTAGRLQLRELLGTFISVCNAVGYSHTRAVVHRDLKPENIAVGEFGEVIVLDWGLAKLLDETEQASGELPVGDLQDAGQTLQGQVMGTPNYMPPEQARGEADSIDSRADIYSLGAILFHIVTGRPPRHADPEDFRQLLAQVAAGEIPTICELDRRAPRELEAICSHAMQHDAADRYQAVTALSDDLKHWLADEPVSVYPEPWFKKAARWARNHKAAVTTAASITIVAVILLASATVFLSAANRRTQKEIDKATREQDNYDTQRVLAEENAKKAIEAEGRAESSEQLARQQRDRARESELEAGRQRDIARQVALESRRQLIRQHITRGMALLEQQHAFEALLWFTRAYELDSQLQQELHPLQTPAQRQARLEDHQLRIHNVLSRCPLPVQIWQPEGGAGQVRFSPTGTVLATSNGHPASPDAGAGQARLWDALNGTPLCPPLTHDQSVNQLLFHHDGTLLATAAGGLQGGGSARVWQVPSGTPAGPVIRSAARIIKVALHPGGTLLATASADGSARVWQIDSGTPASEVMVHDGPLIDIAFSPDGERLVTAAGKHVQTWETKTGMPIGSRTVHPARLGMCRFSADGSRVFTAIQTGYFFQSGPGKLPWRPFLGSGDTSYRLPVLHVSPRDSISLAAGRDGRLVISRQDRTPTLRDWTFDQAISDGHFNQQGDRIIISSYSGEVALISTDNGQLLVPPLLHPAAVLSADISADNRLVATASRDGSVRIWDTALLERGREEFSQPFSLFNAAYAGDGRHFILSTPEHNAVAWRREAPILPVFSLDHQHRIGLVTYGPGNNRIVTATVEGSVHLWDATSGESIADLSAEGTHTRKVIFSQDGKQLATATVDRHIHLWNADDGRHLHQIGPLPSRVSEFAFHPHDPLLLSATPIRPDAPTTLVQGWNTRDGMSSGPPMKINGRIRTLLMHPDGHRVLFHVDDADGDGSHAQFWDIQDGTPAADVIRQRNPFSGVSLNSTGTLLLTSDVDGTVQLWGTETGQPVMATIRHTTPIRDMEFSHHGRFFATATDNGTVQIWSSTSGIPLIPPVDVGPSIVGIAFHPADRELMIMLDRTIRFVEFRGSTLSLADTAAAVSAISGHQLDNDGGQVPLSAVEAYQHVQRLKSDFSHLFSISDQQLFTWHRRHGSRVPAPFWEARRDTITEQLSQATHAYVQYSLRLQRAQSHVELGDYDAALDDLQASHRLARPHFSRGSYSLPLFQRACLAVFLGRSELYTETLSEMINSLDPLNLYDAPRTATANCLSATGHGNLALSIQLAARSVPRSPSPQPFLALSLSLYRSGRHADSRTVAERVLAQRPGHTRLHTALHLVAILAMIAEGDRAEATTQMGLLRDRLSSLPALSSRKLGGNWHELLIVEILRSEVDKALQAKLESP
jgi:WD40 repeat protein/serine/threonine protein kinase